jgi:hypothetical protein
MTRDQEGERRDLNNRDPHINRGFELLLKNRRRKPDKPKFFQIRFGKIFSLFYREIDLYFEISLDLRKNNSREK